MTPKRRAINFSCFFFFFFYNGDEPNLILPKFGLPLYFFFFFMSFFHLQKEILLDDNT